MKDVFRSSGHRTTKLSFAAGFSLLTAVHWLCLLAGSRDLIYEALVLRLTSSVCQSEWNEASVSLGLGKH